MTLVNHETGEIVVSYSEVRASVEKARASGVSFFEQIVWQIENQAWSVLGYSDWDEMRDAEYGDMGVVVPRADRPEIVSRLRRTGMTQQDIAETVGVSVGTVNADLKLSSENEDLAPITNIRGQQRPTSYAPKTDNVTALATAAVLEFPDLAFYVNQGRERDVVNMADDLRRFRDRGELEMRLDNLRRSIAVAKAKQDGTYQPNTTAVMTDAGEYEMRPRVSTTVPEPAVCVTCGQTIGDSK